MKLIKTNIIAALALFTVIAFTACSKDDGAIPERIGIEDVPAVSTNTEAGGTTGSISLANQAAFEGKFKVTMFFAGATPPAKVDIVVRKNGSAANVKLFKADVKTLPANFTVTAAEIATLFGAPLVVKDTYDFAPDIYVNEKKYEAFPAVGLGAGQGVTGMSAVGYGAWVRYTVAN
jgi:hypothetical protein